MTDFSGQSMLWQQAVSFAARRHQGQLRKDGRTPYAAHPMRVALTVIQVFGCQDPTAVCTALLHDVIEDTTADYDDVLRQFGAEIADAVACLSKDKRLPEERREPAFYAQIAQGGWQARLVKLADAFDNVSDADSDAQRRKAIDKAHHAIEAAGDDPRLTEAVTRLRQLLAQHQG
ncbi:MAG: HD domain-containing protein [Pirellulaceae bacterium]